jgi:hypothetical protein
MSLVTNKMIDAHQRAVRDIISEFLAKLTLGGAVKAARFGINTNQESPDITKI